MSGWWERASSEQRLEQIDGGIECGMTARQVAIVCGLKGVRHPGVTVGVFATRHGRSFPHENRQRGNARRMRVGDLKRAYFGGHARDFTDEAMAVAAAPELAEVAFE